MNTSLSLTCIVPRLPPAIDGVGDYALNLARQLRTDFGMETHFIVGDPTWSSATQIEGFPVTQVTARSAATLLTLLPSDRAAVILLHYVGYGYAKRGCPVWLVDGLQRWRTAGVNRFVVTMFHEVYAFGFGPPWTSSFWLSPLQRNLAARLACSSDRILTSRQDYAKVLHQLSRGKHGTIPANPVFSNIGESERLLPLAERKRRLVVFGHRNSRLMAYQQHLAALKQACLALEIEEVCDVGVPTGLELSRLLAIPVVEKGVAQATQVSQLLQDAIAGFLSFPPPEYLAKSTIFAAYCAHRLIPILTSSSAVPVDGLQAGKHYCVADEQIGQLCLDVGQAIADNAYAWYQTHSLSVQAKIFAAHFEH